MNKCDHDVANWCWFLSEVAMAAWNWTWSGQVTKSRDYLPLQHVTWAKRNEERLEKKRNGNKRCVFKGLEANMPYVASSNLGYYSMVYTLSLFILICVGELSLFLDRRRSFEFNMATSTSRFKLSFLILFRRAVLQSLWTWNEIWHWMVSFFQSYFPFNGVLILRIFLILRIY